MIAAGWLFAVVHGAWQGAVAAAMMLGLSAWLRRFPSRLREALLLIALVKFLVPPFLSAPTGVFSQTGDLLALQPIELANDAAVVSSAPAIPWIMWLLFAQIAGTVVVMALAVGGWLRVQRWRRSGAAPGAALANIAQLVGRRLGRSRVPEIVMSDAAPAPVAAGVLRPVVVLPVGIPTSLGAGEIEALLAHEFSHHSRHHLAISWLRVVVCAVWWWHPLVWILSKALQRVQEEVCDDAVVAAGVMAREPYCDMLLRAASAVRPRLAISASFADRLHPLGRRLRRLLEGSPEIRLPNGAAAAAIAILAVVILPGVSLPNASRDSREPVAPIVAYTPYATTVNPDRPTVARVLAPLSERERVEGPAAKNNVFEPETLPIVGDVIRLGESADRAIDALMTEIERHIDPPTPPVAQVQQQIREEAAARIAEPIVQGGAPAEVADRIAMQATRDLTRANRMSWRALGRAIGRSFGSLFSSSDSRSPSPSPSPSPSRSDNPSRSDGPSASKHKP
jgi:beta-lactamase regulating signal transducer with metallopeptidase domain